MLDKCCISINAKCNINCKYCHFYQNDSLDMNSIFSLNYEKLFCLLRNILEYSYLKNLSKFTVGFAGGGEPLLDWDFLGEALREIHTKDVENKLAFYLITNGTLMNKKFLESYRELYSYLKLVISLDGDRQTHDFYRIDKHNKGTHQLIMQNIAFYYEIFSQMPPINLSVSKNSLANKTNILDFLSKSGFKILLLQDCFIAKTGGKKSLKKNL